MTYCTCVASCIKELLKSLQNSSGGQVYMQEAPVSAMDTANTNVEMNEVTSEASNGTGTSKRKKKVIYFSDGSTMEDYEDEDDSTDTKGENIEPMVKCAAASNSESAPPIDTSKMNWPEYARYVSSKAGTKTLSVLEGMGGTAAYYLGITTPKYQSEIDEYNRMAAKKKSHEEELVSWSTGPKTSHEEPVVQDIKKIQSTEGEVPVSEK